MTWLLLVIFYFQDGTTNFQKVEYKTQYECETKRREIFLEMIRKDPFVRIDSECRPVVHYPGL